MQQVTKQVIEVQKRMEELIQATDRVSERLGGAAGGGQRFPTFSEFVAQSTAAEGGARPPQ